MDNVDHEKRLREAREVAYAEEEGRQRAIRDALRRAAHIRALGLEQQFPHLAHVAHLTFPTRGQAQAPEEAAEERQKRRYQACIDAGLRMPDNDYAALPEGIAKVARTLEISRQALAKDVKAHIARTRGK